MAEVFRGTSDFVFLNLYQAGVPIDADSTPAVVVSDERTGVALGAHSVIHVGTGIYKILITLADTALERALLVTWSYAISLDAGQVIETYDVVTPYLTLTKAATKAPGGTSDADLRLAEQYARYTIDNFTNQHFGMRAGVHEAYGQNADVLVLPERVISVSKLYQNGTLVVDGSTPTAEFPFTVEVTDTNFAIRIVSPDLPIQQWTNGGVLNWPGSFKTSFRYKIEGIFGWAYVPADIEFCALLLVNDFFCKDTVWKNKYIQDMSTNDWDVEFNPGAYGGTGNFTADRILENYKWNSMVII